MIGSNFQTSLDLSPEFANDRKIFDKNYDFSLRIAIPGELK